MKMYKVCLFQVLPYAADPCQTFFHYREICTISNHSSERKKMIELASEKPTDYPLYKILCWIKNSIFHFENDQTYMHVEPLRTEN